MKQGTALSVCMYSAHALTNSETYPSAAWLISQDSVIIKTMALIVLDGPSAPYLIFLETRISMGLFSFSFFLAGSVKLYYFCKSDALAI